MITKQGRGIRRIVRTQPLNKTPIDYRSSGGEGSVGVDSWGEVLRTRYVKAGIIRPSWMRGQTPNNDVDTLNAAVADERRKMDAVTKHPWMYEELAVNYGR